MSSLSQVHQQPDSSLDAALNALLNGPYRAVVCECGHVIFTHKGMIRSRCVDVRTGRALCRCKKWIGVSFN
ncbi:hypothetical protein VSP9026_02379 [Vibrio spartinae]|uniref:Uncharacterized protein n=1 Tax=Vibrio spartinae TaxID=1918945 RepID=A0A1N6M5J1_9VIBR|nr:hypothetical protein VSP9026_02379 [Vibrio spartinae]